MDITTLKKIVGAIRTAAPHQRLVLFGSASLLATFPDMGESDTPVQRSRDADFILDPWDDDLALAVHEIVGARKTFDEEHGFYADIVRPFAFENFPPGWDARVVPLDGCPGVSAVDPHDMAIAKIFAGRPKDIELLSALIGSGRLDPVLLHQRLGSIEITESKWIVRSHSCLREVAEKGGKPLPP